MNFFLERKISLAVFIMMVIGHFSEVHAQTTLSGDHVINGDLTVGTSLNKSKALVIGETGNNALPGLQVFGDGGVVFSGTQGVGRLPDTSFGSHLMWYPKKAAIVTAKAGANYLDANIGTSSVSFDGYASGQNSLAVNAWAIGGNSTSLNSSYATGEGSFAAASSASEGDGSIALGSGNAQGFFSVAFSGGIAVGDFSMAMGVNADTNAISTGKSAVAIGAGAIAAAYGSIVLGSGIAQGNPDNWVETDPVFVVGNGSASSDNPDIFTRNAFVIYKNGDARFIKRQGDILMGEFGNPE